MLFYTDKLSIFHIANAAHRVNANLKTYQKEGSRIRKHKYKITFNAPLLDRQSATWNQVGCIISDLFDIDPEMVVRAGSNRIVYKGRDDFHDKTDDEFRYYYKNSSPVNPLISQNCNKHKWKDVTPHGDTGLIKTCEKCGISFYPYGRDVIKAGV